MKKVIYFIFVFLFVSLLYGCNNHYDILIENEVKLGDSFFLDVTIKDKTGYYKSSNKSVIEIDGDYAYAIDEGKSIISYYLYDKLIIEKEVVVTDKKGINNMFTKIDEKLKELIAEEVDNKDWLIMPYTKELEIIQSIVYPNTVTKLRPGEGLVGTKMPGGPKYVVIHNTGMPEAHHDAKGVANYFHEQANNPGGRVASWHYTIDDKEVYQHIPDDEIGWHAGDGSVAYGQTYYNETYKYQAIGGGNQNGIGIESCINEGGNLHLTFIRTAKLTADLLKKHGLGIDDVKQHYHFSGKNCPQQIREVPGRWEQFLKHVEFQLLLIELKEQDEDLFFEAAWKVVQKDLVSNEGTISKGIINDSFVNLEFNLTINEVSRKFDYKVEIKGMTPNQKINAYYEELRNEIIPNPITTDIVLPSFTEKYNIELTWRSDNPSLVDNGGNYTKPVRKTLINLYVTMKIGDIELERRIPVYVE